MNITKLIIFMYNKWTCGLVDLWTCVKNDVTDAYAVHCVACGVYTFYENFAFFHAQHTGNKQ